MPLFIRPAEQEVNDQISSHSFVEARVLKGGFIGTEFLASCRGRGIIILISSRCSECESSLWT